MALNDPVRSELSHLANLRQGAITASGKMNRAMSIMGTVLCLVMSAPVSGDTWRGIQVAPENRCSEYDRQRDYRYPQSVEEQIVQEIGAIYGPYTGTFFDSMRESDIEHIVAVSEAHDSGLCARDRTIRRQFASDVRNLTLARPDINRNQKRAKDAAEWLPDRNRCWFANRVVEVRRVYDLTIDQKEADALDRILSNCVSVDMDPFVCDVNFQ